MAENRVYGIDLGTTYSCIAYVDEHGRPVVVPNAENELTTASVVYLESAENVVVGSAAKEVAEVHPDRCVTAVKLNMGDANWEFAANGEVFKPQDISSFILKKVVKDAETVTGDSIKDVVITCPAYFGLNQKEATKQAGMLAGLNVLYVIPEPTAAAIAYGMEQETDQTILVYDLGGGTFDITLIRVAAGEITVVCTGGDDKLGGKNWDEALVEFFAAAFETETGTPAKDLVDDKEVYQELLNIAEKCKKKLSSSTNTNERVRFGADRVAVELTRQKFAEITASYLERTISLTHDMLARAKDKGVVEMDKLLLVGGSCYMPQVMERVSAEFPFEVKMFDPNQAVAKGAAIFGHKCYLEEKIKIQIAEATGQEKDEVKLEDVSANVLDNATRQVASEAGLALPGVKRLTKTKITNVSSKSFGIVVMDLGKDKEMVNNLIIIDDPAPRDITRQFGTYIENQSEVELRLMENQERTAPKDTIEISICTEIGVAVLAFAHALPVGSPIEVTFRLGPDGLLVMDAKDLTTGREVHVERKTESIMSKEELDKAASRNLAMSVGG